MSERDGYPPGVPCWIDTWRPEPEAAAGFYAALFGWEVEDVAPAGRPARYLVCRLRGRDVAAVCPPPPGAAPAEPAWRTYVRVERADAAAAAAAAAGGRVVAAPFDSFDGGRMAVVADPPGALLGLWQPGSHRGAQLVNEPGAWSWSGLRTRDPERATAFYAALFGWAPDTFQADGGELVLWRVPGYLGGEPGQPVARDVVAGMDTTTAARLPDDARPRWEVDFVVADVDAAAAGAARLGGRVLAGPLDTSVGRTARLADPDGAVFTVSRLGPPA